MFYVFCLIANDPKLQNTTKNFKKSPSLSISTWFNRVCQGCHSLQESSLEKKPETSHSLSPWSYNTNSMFSLISSVDSTSGTSSIFISSSASYKRSMSFLPCKLSDSSTSDSNICNASVITSLLINKFGSNL